MVDRNSLFTRIPLELLVNAGSLVAVVDNVQQTGV